MPRCKLENCPVAKDGRCLENRGSACPNLIDENKHADTSPAPPRQTELKESPKPSFEELPNVSPLAVEDAVQFARRGRARLVALVGLRESGKTSLLARLHQQFQAGPVESYDFAGSRSLPHLEELNWLATIESGAPNVAMTRSSAQFDNSLLHLAVRPIAGGDRTDLLLNDITGETFKAAVASKSTCDGLVCLARADHLVILLDGAALAAATTRGYQVNQAHEFTLRVLQSGQCGSQTAFQVVFSKTDKLKGHEAVADHIEQEFRQKFGPRVGSLDFHRIAARPTDSSLPTVEPIGKLFSTWIQTSHRYTAPATPSPGRAEYARDFCRFGI